METKIKELIAIGASITAHCQPCLRHHVAKARECGADEKEIDVAIAVGRTVRTGAAAKMDELSAELGATAVGQKAGQTCGCGA